MQAAAFAKAISVDVKEVSVIERVSLDSMPVEAGYDGPRLENDTDVTADFMERLLEHYRELVNGRVGVIRQFISQRSFHFDQMRSSHWPT